MIVCMMGWPPEDDRVVTLDLFYKEEEKKMLCNRKTHALRSRVIISSPDTWSTSYKQVSTMLTMIL